MCNYSSNLEQLKIIFPNTDESTIISVLDEASGNLELCVEKILKSQDPNRHSDTDSKLSFELQRDRQMCQDEAYARELAEEEGEGDNQQYQSTSSGYDDQSPRKKRRSSTARLREILGLGHNKKKVSEKETKEIINLLKKC